MPTDAEMVNRPCDVQSILIIKENDTINIRNINYFWNKFQDNMINYYCLFNLNNI